jgi:acetate kinase
MTVLAVNAGSSTLKFALYALDGLGDGPVLLSGSVDWLANAGAFSLAWTANGHLTEETLPCAGSDIFASALSALQRVLVRESASVELRAVAHRVVHGGSVYRQPVLVNPGVLENLEKLSALAPLHQPNNLNGIRAFAKAFPSTPQIACFDTAFHACLPEVEYRFALPPDLLDEGVRRYGFHGLSYQFVAQSLASLTPRSQGRTVVAHLGSGASLCAMLGGKSRATSMGFSALDGLIMGTRCGSLDAGVLLHLLAQGWDHARLEQLLYRQSGLLGVSGATSDMRRLRASGDIRAALAISMFTYRVIREAGAMTACLGGLDVLAFTGGIGEHDAMLRAEVCAQLAYLGVRLDGDKNSHTSASQAAPLHASDSAVEVWMVPTDEGRVAAQSANALLRAGSIH